MQSKLRSTNWNSSCYTQVLPPSTTRSDSTLLQFCIRYHKWKEGRTFSRVKVSGYLEEAGYQDRQICIYHVQTYTHARKYSKYYPSKLRSEKGNIVTVYNSKFSDTVFCEITLFWWRVKEIALPTRSPNMHSFLRQILSLSHCIVVWTELRWL